MTEKPSIYIYDLCDQDHDDDMRIYEHDGIMHSACYLDQGRHADLVFAYLRKMNIIFSLLKEPKDILLFGAGAFSYPKYVLAHYPDIVIDVADPDPDCERIAREYFFLDEFAEKGDPRLNVFVNDGCSYMETCDKKYDVIINDASSGARFASDLMSQEAFIAMKTHLKENGFIIVNAPGRVVPTRSPFLFQEVSTLKSVFAHVSCISASGYASRDEVINYLLFASDSPFTLPEDISELKNDTTVIHDNSLDEADTMLEKDTMLI